VLLPVGGSSIRVGCLGVERGIDVELSGIAVVPRGQSGRLDRAAGVCGSGCRPTRSRYFGHTMTGNAQAHIRVLRHLEDLIDARVQGVQAEYVRLASSIEIVPADPRYVEIGIFVNPGGLDLLLGKIAHEDLVVSGASVEHTVRRVSASIRAGLDGRVRECVWRRADRILFGAATVSLGDGRNLKYAEGLRMLRRFGHATCRSFERYQDNQRHRVRWSPETRPKATSKRALRISSATPSRGRFPTCRPIRRTWRSGRVRRALATLTAGSLSRSRRRPAHR